MAFEGLGLGRTPAGYDTLKVSLYDVTKSANENLLPSAKDSEQDDTFTHAGIPIYPAPFAQERVYMRPPDLVGGDKHPFEEGLTGPLLWADDESCLVFCSKYDIEGARLVSLWFGKTVTERVTVAYSRVDPKEWVSSPVFKEEFLQMERDRGEAMWIKPDRLVWKDPDHVEIVNPFDSRLPPSIVLPLPKP